MSRTKDVILSEMKELQQQYSKRSSELKDLAFIEDKAEYEARQLARLAEYKSKYNFYIKDGEAKPINWDEVEKLVRTSFDSFGKPAAGYSLGFDQTGMEGLGCDYGNGGDFTPMVEDESDAPKFLAREKRRKEFIARAKAEKK